MSGDDVSQDSDNERFDFHRRVEAAVAGNRTMFVRFYMPGAPPSALRSKRAWSAF